MREKITLAECKPGDVVDEEVIDIRTGIVLCQKNFMLTEESIQWLNKFLPSDIYIYKSTLESVWHLSNELIKAYSERKKKLSTVLYYSAKNNQINCKILEEIQDNLFKQFNRNTLLVGCVNIVKGMDERIYGHGMNVGILASLIGKWISLPQDQIEELFLAGVLHDVGKYKLNRELVHKIEPLTDEENKQMKLHTIYSYKIIEDNADISENVKQAVLCHHECIDGTGYPMGLKGERINLFTRVLTIANTYDALLSRRTYDKTYTAFKAMRIMLNDKINVLDTEILLKFLRTMANYYIGIQVKLSTGKVGEVVFVHPHCIYNPIVRVDEEYIDLDKQNDISIIEML